MELKGTRTTTTTRPRNALTAASNILSSRERSALHMDLCVRIARRKITGQGLAAPETKEEHEAGKGTEKTLGCVITAGVKTDANEVFLTINVDLHSIGSHTAALKAKLDTGAQGNILPLRLYRRMCPENLTPGALEHSPTVRTAYGGAKLMQHGKCQITCDFKGRKSVAAFSVTEADGPAIIGLLTSLELNLVTLNCSAQQSSPLNANRPPEQGTPIKDKDDLV